MIGTPIVGKNTLQTAVPIDSVAMARMVSWLNDPEVVRYSEQRHRRHTIETQAGYIERVTFSETGCISAIFHGQTFIGTTVHWIDRPNSIANVGIMIGDPAYRGRGFGFEAWSNLCNFLLVRERIRKIEAGCMRANKAMMSICANSGMINEGCREDHFLLGETIDGEYVTTDLVLWGKTL